MKNLSKPCFLLFLIFIGCGTVHRDQLVHKVLIYEKSNWDGSNKGKIAVYREKPDQLESFKWHDGNQHATIVRAKLDEHNHTVKHFDVYRMTQQENENLAAVLHVSEDKTISVQLGDHRQDYPYPPSQWHSYDFDFASLGYAFPWLKKEDQPIIFNVLDLDLNESPPKLKDFGVVKMLFLQEEDRGARKLLKYDIDGPGLDHRGGAIWFDKTDGFLVSFEIEKPDEPGYDSGKLVLKEILQMDTGEWRDFKKKKLRPN